MRPLLHPARCVLAVLAALLLAAGLASSPAHAQAARPDRAAGAARQWTVQGRVVLRRGETVTGVPALWVVLHRVASDSAGPLDSLRTAAEGGYRFRYQAREDDDAVYLVSASFAGVAYFSQPLPEGNAGLDAAEITVFDTTSARWPLRVAGHHIVVSTPSVDGSRDMVEVYELSNDSSLTLVSADERNPTWSARLPAGATDFRAMPSDVSAGTMQERGGVLRLSAPFSPGIRQLSFSYKLPADRFPLAIRLAERAELLEVLLEDAGGTATAPGLAAPTSVAVQGRTFRRYLGSNVPAGATVRVTVPAVGGGSSRWLVPALLALVTAAMLVALWFVLARRPRSATLGASAASSLAAAQSPAPEDAESLARAIAALDREFELATSPSAADRATYERRRQALKSRLVAALASRGATAGQ